MNLIFNLTADTVQVKGNKAVKWNRKALRKALREQFKKKGWIK